MWRHRRLLAVVVVAALWVSACASATDSGPPPVELRGTWQYAAVQTAPSGATIAGVLTVSGQAGKSLSGSIDVTEDADGHTRRLTGPVSGRALDATTVDFDAFVEGSDRRHVGTVRADTITGEWVDFSGGVPGASGTFRLERESAP
jgi:hypothetical protein